MKTENGTNTILLIIGIIILFSEPISEQFILNDKKCPVYNHTPKLISIVHHPKLNKGFIILVSCKKANSIIQTSLKMLMDYILLRVMEKMSIYYIIKEL